MKKKLYYFGVIWGVVIITAFLIFTACQNSNKTSEPEICTSCHGDKTITCRSCLGKGRVACDHCDGYGTCYWDSCEEGYIYDLEDCSSCTNGVIVNPFTWATFDCPKCDYGYVEVGERCWFCDGEDECIFCDGTGLAGFCKDCQGRGKIDCTDCD